MLALNPADIVTKLRLLFIVVISLFGVMNVGAALGFVLDARERAHFLLSLQSPEVGFRVAEDGGGKDDVCWLWRFSLDAMQDELEPPHGPAVRLCGLLGVPCARLRAALPDALLRRWDMATVLGRRHALSKCGMTSSLAAQKQLVPRLLFSSARSNAPGAAAAAAAAAPRIPPPEASDEAAAAADEQLELFCGTALVLAFVQVVQLLPVTDLARRKSAAKRHFRGTLTPAGYDFA
jgi:hypothetical protein